MTEAELEAHTDAVVQLLIQRGCMPMDALIVMADVITGIAQLTQLLLAEQGLAVGLQPVH